MISALVVTALAATFIQGPQVADSGGRLGPPVDSTQRALPAPGVTNRATGPRIVPIAFSLARLRETAAGDANDTTSRRPRAIEYDDDYYTRLTIHRVASYAELPLFGAEYVLGERLLHDERTGFPPSSLKAAHLGVAGGLGVLFAVNTVTGAWNLWDSRQDPANRTLRIIHSAAMLGADAGFAWAGAIGGNAKHSLHGAQQHRAVSVGSMALATAGTAMMWLFDK